MRVVDNSNFKNPLKKWGRIIIDLGILYILVLNEADLVGAGLLIFSPILLFIIVAFYSDPVKTVRDARKIRLHFTGLVLASISILLLLLTDVDVNIGTLFSVASEAVLTGHLYALAFLYFLFFSVSVFLLGLSIYFDIVTLRKSEEKLAASKLPFLRALLMSFVVVPVIYAIGSFFMLLFVLPFYCLDEQTELKPSIACFKENLSSDYFQQIGQGESSKR